ncbi:hypothetical protein RSOLAG22IIIB_11506 [Rhizoctonia solani]|uniref:Uncharacterized protein n=1 Tax=Rhizoctonia solani TaxID=456999 RepID=A0A0K6G8J8_9AGAM|nr:hypothetical protein RSOLAG22IIIB_11506 [Rhizoctonia solani]
MLPRVVRDLERQVVGYVTQCVEQKIRKHIRRIGKQIRKRKDFSPLETIGSVVARISKQAQKQINQQLGSLDYSYDLSQPLNTGPDQKMTIDEFCRLDLIGQVIMIECFQEADHAFILVHAKGLYPRTPSDQMVWIRLERGLKKNGSVGYFQAMFMKTTLAYNTATISYQLKSIAPPDASPIGENTLVFNGLKTPVTLKHLVSLLEMMDEAVFSPFKDNCWVFCQTIIDCMEPYQSKAIQVKHPEINRERRMDLKRRFTSSITDLHSYGFTSES